MSDILLIQPPIEDFYLTAKRTMPYGLASIAAALRQDGFSVALVDALATSKNRPRPWPDELAFLQPFFGRADRSPFALFHQWRHFGHSLERIARLAQSSGAWLIGISSPFSAYADMALATAAAIKKVCPRASVVLGGHHPSMEPEAVMRHPGVDFVLRGDGEEGLPLLARALQNRIPPGGIPGLVRRGPQGMLQQNPSAQADLNLMPIPAFDLIDWRFYRRFGKASAAVSAGRGCPQHCTYCAVNAATGHDYRRRSAAAVVAELEAIDRLAQLGFVDFEDEHLCADRAWFMDLLRAIRRRFADRRIELRAMNGLFAPALDEAVIERMRQAGFKTLNLALITTSVAQLKRFNRPDLSTHIDRVLHLAGRSELNAVAYLMVAGPGQDPVTSLADLLYLAQRRVLAGVSVFYPAPGSADYRWCERHGLLPDRFGLMRATALPLAHVTDRVQTVTLLRLGRLLNFMKRLLDEGLGLPAPDRPPATIPSQVDRHALGRILLAAFLKDGLIYGVDGEGRVYPHRIDADLSRGFLDGLGKIRVRGAKAGK